jgi:hypothetical protein
LTRDTSAIAANYQGAVKGVLTLRSSGGAQIRGNEDSLTNIISELSAY